jgi:hypothetical protein
MVTQKPIQNTVVIDLSSTKPAALPSCLDETQTSSLKVMRAGFVRQNKWEEDTIFCLTKDGIFFSLFYLTNSALVIV